MGGFIGFQYDLADAIAEYVEDLIPIGYFLSFTSKKEILQSDPWI